MLSMLAANILVGSIRILAGGILAGGRRTMNCDFVDNPLRLDSTLGKTKRHPMHHRMKG